MIIEIGKLNETETVCTLCKIRKATVLCDFPESRSHFAGHPPKVNGAVNLKEPMSWTNTCDRPMCEKCAIKMDNEIHICTSCCAKLTERMNSR
jgi:hypothetical protein